jgi:hypothetical protein
MAVLTFDPSRVNFIEVEGGGGWFLTVLGDGAAHLLPTRCPHRGGPLHLGTIDPKGEAVLCPWHDNPVRVRWLQKNALPLIRRRGGLWTAVVPDSAGDPRAVRRAVLVGQPGSPAGCGGHPNCASHNCNKNESEEQ